MTIKLGCMTNQWQAKRNEKMLNTNPLGGRNKKPKGRIAYESQINLDFYFGNPCENPNTKIVLLKSYIVNTDTSLAKVYPTEVCLQLALFSQVSIYTKKVCDFHYFS